MLKHIQNKETRIYIRCLFLLPIFVLLAILFQSGYSLPSLLRPPCLFRSLTGFSCPGCGCTRAVIALLQGNVLQSLCYNPGILYCAALYTLYILSHTVSYVSSFVIHKVSTHSPGQIPVTDMKKLPSGHRVAGQPERSFLTLLSQIHGMKARPIYLYILIYLFLIFGILRFFVELWQRLH